MITLMERRGIGQIKGATLSKWSFGLSQSTANVGFDSRRYMFSDYDIKIYKEFESNTVTQR